MLTDVTPISLIKLKIKVKPLKLHNNKKERKKNFPGWKNRSLRTEREPLGVQVYHIEHQNNKDKEKTQGLLKMKKLENKFAYNMIGTRMALDLAIPSDQLTVVKCFQNSEKKFL